MKQTGIEQMARIAESIDLWRMGQLSAEEALQRVRLDSQPPSETRAFWRGEDEIYDKGLG